MAPVDGEILLFSWWGCGDQTFSPKRVPKKSTGNRPNSSQHRHRITMQIRLRKAYKVSIQVSEGVSSTGLRKQGLQMARFNSSRLDSLLFRVIYFSFFFFDRFFLGFVAGYVFSPDVGSSYGKIVLSHQLQVSFPKRTGTKKKKSNILPLRKMRPRLFRQRCPGRRGV